MKRGYADTTSGQIHYREIGEGSPLLLLHHTASSSDMWTRIMPLLAAGGHRVIAMDTPGFGSSDALEGTVDMAAYGRAAVGLLDDLGIDRATVIAVRTGASIAVELATTHPERVERLVITGLVAIPTAEAREAKLAEPSREANPWPVDGRGAFLDDHILSWVRMFAAEDDGEQYLRELIAALQAGPDFYKAYEAVVRFDAWDRLPRIACPTLFINPEGDAGFDDALEIRERVAGRDYVEMSGLHAPTPGWVWAPAIYPQEYADAVLAFTRRS